MKNIYLIIFMLSTLTTYSQDKNISTKDFSIGDIVELNSTILNENRVLNIYLPRGYKTDSITKKYPVIYLLDGSADEDFIHISGLVQFGSFSWINHVPESIVVGISNIDRKRDFTAPTNVKEHQSKYPTTGGSSSFINFIEKELQPFIDKNYRTTSSKTLIGQSLGGLLASEILLTRPNLFNNYLIVSPSLWWNDEYLLKNQSIILQPNYSEKKTIFVAVGLDEDPIMVREAKALFDLLKTSKNNVLEVNYKALEKKDHGNVLHQAAYHGLIFLNKEK